MDQQPRPGADIRHQRSVLRSRNQVVTPQHGAPLAARKSA